MRLLLVEDTRDLAEATQARFEREGIACDLAGTVAAAEDCLAVQRYDVIVLDINLPDGTGTELLARLRARGARVPVLMLTANFSVEDRVGSLNLGADDYLVKPFDHRELEARVRALWRREQGQKGGEQRLGGLVWDAGARLLRVGDTPVALTRRELSLFDMLARQPGTVLSKERLFEGLYTFDEADVGLNAVELYVARLRKKLAPGGVRIETQRGIGYRLVADG
ncbi:response regulator transcription factor [Frigidibacter sp. MR17.24]|uniref:response regulator transcription factor n=1 Tax=Frigidibacter sp. MR17.24 TaxID=3127345 RepID=UPI003012D160